jgi:signal transduction histidine kinase
MSDTKHAAPFSNGTSMAGWSRSFQWGYPAARASLQNQMVSALIILYQGLAVLIFVAAPLLAFRWLRRPFFEVFTEPVLLIPYATGLIYLASSLWAFGIRRTDETRQAFAVFTASLAIALVGLFDSYTSHRLTYIWVLAIALAGGALFNLGLLFPQEVRLVERYPFLRWVGYVPAIGLALFAFSTLNGVSNPELYFLARRLEFVLLSLGAILFMVWTGSRRLISPSPIVREQSLLILWGSFISFSPMLAFFITRGVEVTVKFTPLLLLPLGAFPLVTGYAILRYRLPSTDYLLSRAVLVTLMSVLIAAGYALLVSGASLVFGEVVSASNPLLIGFLVFILALCLNPLRLYLQKAVDNVFFKGQTGYREQMQEFGHELTQILDLEGTTAVLREYVARAFFPAQFHIFVHDAPNDHYIAAQDDRGRLTSDLRFTADSSISQVLAHRKASLFLKGGHSLPPTLIAERARLALLGANLFVPLLGQQRLVGWMALGPRRSGEPYTTNDVAFLESLADQSALAIEKAQVVTDLERQVHQMDVITRLAQGINITLAFDDLLELFYAQTSHLLPVRDFRITLLDDTGGSLYHAFYLDNDERLSERENQQLPARQGLEAEVVRGQRSIVAVDYEQECRSRGLLPETRGIKAWMGVPLNAGANTIGALSLGSRDPAVAYTREQLNLLLTIADLAAGAILKARLLEETETSVLQMRTLNEIARSISSTLDLDPLLQEIVQSAVDILECEAGSLLMVDENTAESVFEVAIGPVGAELVGQRVPPGAGLVGKAVITGEAIIQNDVRRSNEWFNTDKETGYSTQDLLVVPMKVKDRVIGVLEVLNKRERSPFTLKDQELLSAFAAQAVVAIENARLYTLTDQALAARVEELSVMQRIDRELNASLDVERAMRITLEWASRQSKAEAGLVGVVTGEGLRVMVSQGYTNELEAYKDSLLPLDLPLINEAIEGGQPHCRLVAAQSQGTENQTDKETGQGSNDFRLLDRTQSQVVVPIRRESKTIGLLFLESVADQVCPDEVMAFLSRLSDHASIAISNAQLYSAVQTASLAKSQFVSAAAHELKNPLTSIKGYADLLVAGAVGQVNEGQANFLSTIRSNAERMSALVSDLQDLSRIEAGQLRLQFGRVVLSEIIDEVTRSLLGQIEAKGQQLVLEVCEDLPQVWGDRVRLFQILTNLVSNAHKYTPQNGQITVQAKPAANQDDPAGGSRSVHVTVQDTGIGISPADQRKIFQQFFRSEDPKVREVTGTGLGLSITKNLVEMQGGSIWFESQVGKGTSFHFVVPVAESG